MTESDWKQRAMSRALRITELERALRRIAIHGHLEGEQTECDDCCTSMQTIAAEALA